jgi:hypothetical protein
VVVLATEPNSRPTSKKPATAASEL